MDFTRFFLITLSLLVPHILTYDRVNSKYPRLYFCLSVLAYLYLCLVTLMLVSLSFMGLYSLYHHFTWWSIGLSIFFLVLSTVFCFWLRCLTIELKRDFRLIYKDK